MTEHQKVKRVAKRYFDIWAQSYDESILQHLIFRSSHHMLFKEITGSGRSSKFRVLDAGCGTGELSFKLSNYLGRAEVHGVDLSRTMIEKAKDKLDGHNIKFKVGDVEHLPYKDNAFDVITCSHSFHHYPNKEKAISEMYRVLRPDGRLMIIDGCRDVFLGKIIFEIVERIERHVYHLFGHEFRELFKRSGFKNVVQKKFNFVPLLLTIGTAIK
ncbi:MAG: class I SAM-dependent methyltransferase [Candidatus Omnitrophica bacterium]|nr:class I SAM-dependent methyltransferase [Candidatus Omnitrophota bacterium]